MEIKDIKALKILNANSNFTVEVMLTAGKGKFRGSSPARKQQQI
jgi:Enolase, N-terminal domain.